MNLKEIVESWGLPEYYKGKKLTLNFDGKNLEIKDEKGNLKFEMAFVCYLNVSRMFKSSQKRDEIDLHYIHVVEPEDRKKGVSSFYLSKLAELCKENNITTVKIGVATHPETTDAIKNDNCLTHDELTKFYKKHLGKDLEVEFF